MADRTVRVRLEAAVSGFRAAMQQSGADVRKFSNDLKGSIRSNKAELTTLGMAAGAMGLAAAAGIRSVLTSGAEYQSSMNQVRAVTGATGDQMVALSGQARELGASTKFSASESADAMYFLSSAGFAVNDVMSAMPGVLQLAAAGNMDLATTADIASNVLSGYGLEVSDLSRVNDVLAATFKSTNTNIAQAGEAMKFVAPVAAAAGIEFEEAAAAIGLLGNAGIQGSMAGTTLRGVITGLLNPTAEAAKILDELGVNAVDSSGQLIPLADIVEQLGDAGATTGELMQIFGQRAGPGLAALLSQGAGALREQTQLGLESAGTAADIASIQMEGLGGAVTELGSAFEGLKIALFESGGGDFAEDVVRKFTGMIQVLESAPSAVHTTAMGLGGVAAAVGTVGGAALIAAPRIVDTMDAISKLGGVSGMAKGGLAGLARFGLHPVTLAVGFVVASFIAFTEQAREAAAGADRLRADLGGAEASFASLNDEILIAELREKGVLELFRDTGLSLDDLRVGLTGSRDSWQELTSATRGALGPGNDFLALLDTLPLIDTKQDADRLNEALGHLRGGVMTLNEQVAAENDLLFATTGQFASVTHAVENGLDPALANLALTNQAAADAQDDSAAAAAALGGEFGEQEGAIEDATAAHEAYIDSIRSATDPVYALFSALDAVEDATRELDEAEKDSKTTSAELERLTIAKTRALDNLETAAIDGSLSFEQFEGRLERWIRKGRITQEEADRIRARVAEARGEAEDFHGDYEASLGLKNYDQVATDLIRIERNADRAARDRSFTIRASWSIPAAPKINTGAGTVRIPGTASHTGGWSQHGTAHSGILGTNEVFKVLERDEFVVRKEQARRHGPLLAAINAGRMHDGGVAGRGSSSSPGTAPGTNIELHIESHGNVRDDALIAKAVLAR
jgi:TP901 family phage tail tape measure protein